VAAVKAWIINLERSHGRRVHMEHQLVDHLSGLKHEFVVAVDGLSLKATERAALVDEEAVARLRMTPGLIGAVLSHRVVWQRISAGEQPVGLVLEDDVVLSKNVEAIISEAAEHMAGAEVVLGYFQSREPCRFTRTGAVCLSDGRYLAQPVDADRPLCAAAYLITREAAERLAAFVLPVRINNDWKSRRDAHGIDRLRCIVPSPIATDPDFRSTLGYTETGSVGGRVLDIVATYRLPPFHQAMRALRSRRLRRERQYVFVDNA